MELHQVPALEGRLANRSVASAIFDRGPTTTRLCAIFSRAVVSDLGHFGAGSVDFVLVVVKRCTWGTRSGGKYQSESGQTAESTARQPLTSTSALRQLMKLRRMYAPAAFAFQRLPQILPDSLKAFVGGRICSHGRFLDEGRR